MIERRYGICRTVYLIGPWAIKVPRLRAWPRENRQPMRRKPGSERLWSWTRGVQANLSETEWSGIEGVAPVLRSWLGGIVNVYPRCEPWPDDWPDPSYDKIGEGWLPRDRKRENVGLLAGVAVWVDYDGSWNGCPHARNACDLSLTDDE